MAATIGTVNISNIVSGRPTSFIVRNRGNMWDNVANDVVSVEFPASADRSDGFMILTNSALAMAANHTAREHNGTSWSTTTSAPAMLIKGAA